MIVDPGTGGDLPCVLEAQTTVRNQTQKQETENKRQKQEGENKRQKTRVTKRVQ